MKSISLFLISLNFLFSACQPGLSNPIVKPTSPGRTTVITSTTKEPKLPKVLTPGLELKVIAGAGQAGDKDGPALEAQFNTPSSLAKDMQGNLYIAESRNNKIRKLNTDNQVVTLAGTGNINKKNHVGEFKSIDFHYPRSIVFWAPDYLLVSDDSLQISLLNLSTQQSELFTDIPMTQTEPINDYKEYTALPLLGAGAYLIAADPSSRDSFFFFGFTEIWKVEVQKSKYIYRRYAGNGKLADTSNMDSQPLDAYFKDGTVDDSLFYYPTGLALDRAGNAFVTDKSNHRIRKISAQTREVTTLSGFSDPDPVNSFFSAPQGAFRDGSLKEARFRSPIDIVMLPDESMIVLDLGNKAIRMILNGQVRTLVRNLESADIFWDGNTLYLTDMDNHQIYSMDLSGLEALKPLILAQELQP